MLLHPAVSGIGLAGLRRQPAVAQRHAHQRPSTLTSRHRVEPFALPRGPLARRQLVTLGEQICWDPPLTSVPGHGTLLPDLRVHRSSSAL
jgi:hypothetical protein